MNIRKFLRRKKYIKYLDEYVRIYKKLPVKKTARCPRQMILEDHSYKKYLLVSGKTDIEKFYIKRAIELQREHYKQFVDTGFDINVPLDVWEEEDILFILYNYYDKFFYAVGEKPQKYIEDFVNNNFEEIEVDADSVERIKENFLNIFPTQYRERIMNLDLYNEYFEEITSMSRIKVCFEHGDYAKNNILITNQGHFFLMDFEFAAEYQPVGYDLYTYNRTIGLDDKSIINYELSQKREKLEDEINNILDEEYGLKK